MTSNNIYFVRDRVSKLCTSQPILCNNDVVALNGFKTFINSLKETDLPKETYALIRSANCNEFGFIESVGDPIILAYGNSDLDELIKVATEKYIKENEGEF